MTEVAFFSRYALAYPPVVVPPPSARPSAALTPKCLDKSRWARSSRFAAARPVGGQAALEVCKPPPTPVRQWGGLRPPNPGSRSLRSLHPLSRITPPWPGGGYRVSWLTNRRRVAPMICSPGAARDVIAMLPEERGRAIAARDVPTLRRTAGSPPGSCGRLRQPGRNSLRSSLLTLAAPLATRCRPVSTTRPSALNALQVWRGKPLCGGPSRWTRYSPCIHPAARLAARDNPQTREPASDLGAMRCAAPLFPSSAGAVSVGCLAQRGRCSDGRGA